MLYQMDWPPTVYIYFFFPLILLLTKPQGRWGIVSIFINRKLFRRGWESNPNRPRGNPTRPACAPEGTMRPPRGIIPPEG